MTIACPFCHTPSDKGKEWSYHHCERHLPVRVEYCAHAAGRCNEIEYLLDYQGIQYAMTWAYSMLSVEKEINGPKGIGYSVICSDLKNIPVVPPEQAEQLLKRLLNNLAFS